VVKGEDEDQDKAGAAVETLGRARVVVVEKGAEAEVSDLVVIVFAPTAVLLFHIKQVSPAST